MKVGMLVFETSVCGSDGIQNMLSTVSLRNTVIAHQQDSNWTSLHVGTNIFSYWIFYFSGLCDFPTEFYRRDSK
jgi:hypothetical protein